MTQISDDKFMEIVECMLARGGEWKVSMSKDGFHLTYEGETHRISEKHAEVMFQTIPRKCTS
jgi:hypothetical protein